MKKSIAALAIALTLTFTGAHAESAFAFKARITKDGDRFEEVGNLIKKSGCLSPGSTAESTEENCMTILKNLTIIEWRAMENYDRKAMDNDVYRAQFLYQLANTRELYRVMGVSPSMNGDFVAPIRADLKARGVITDKAVKVHNELDARMYSFGSNIAYFYSP